MELWWDGDRGGGCGGGVRVGNRRVEIHGREESGKSKNSVQ